MSAAITLEAAGLSQLILTESVRFQDLKRKEDSQAIAAYVLGRMRSRLAADMQRLRPLALKAPALAREIREVAGIAMTGYGSIARPWLRHTMKERRYHDHYAEKCHVTLVERHIEHASNKILYVKLSVMLAVGLALREDSTFASTEFKFSLVR